MFRLLIKLLHLLRFNKIKTIHSNWLHPQIEKLKFFTIEVILTHHQILKEKIRMQAKLTQRSSIKLLLKRMENSKRKKVTTKRTSI